MQNKGWIKINRSMLDWEWYDDIPTSRLFLHLLLTVNYSDSRWKGIEIKAGSRVSGRHKLSQETGLSPMQIRRSLSALENTAEITIKKTTKFSIISITKWEQYQSKQPTNNQQTTNKQPHLKKERIKENINITNINKDNIAPDGVSDVVWKDFVRHRKHKRSAVTDTVIERIRAEANKAGWTLQDALIEICLRGWQGFKADWVKPKKGQTKTESRAEQREHDLLETTMNVMRKFENE